MTSLNDAPFALLHFYATSPYPCSYLAGRLARSQVASPSHVIDTELYGELVKSGFRRSGIFSYRPWCDTCRACVPVRLDVARFQSSRSQRRAQKRHLGMEVRQLPLAFDEEHYQLYQRYQAARHAGGGMDQDSREQYSHFLLQSHVDTALVEFREEGVLRMVSVIDLLPDGLSSVYTFYDPDISDASYGTASILWQVEQCRRLGLPWLYLGYWIKESPKMAYKSRFRPIQGRIRGNWRLLTLADTDPGRASHDSFVPG
jgi:arginine-tRNA-protein transferase